MSISSSQTLPNGVVATYWILSTVHASLVNSVVSVTIDGYLSQSAYSSNLSPVISYTYSIPMNIQAYLNGNGTLAEIYNTIVSNQPAFSGASVVSDSV